MESTGRYHEPIRNVLFKAGLFVCTVNPHLIKNYGNNTIRKVKTDSTDNSSHASKCGPSRLRHTLFQIMTTILQTGGKEDDAVSSFLFKKKAENKPYLVYMTAGANKFLRVYYGKVKECLRNQEQAEE